MAGHCDVMGAGAIYLSAPGRQEESTTATTPAVAAYGHVRSGSLSVTAPCPQQRVQEIPMCTERYWSRSRWRV